MTVLLGWNVMRTRSPMVEHLLAVARARGFRRVSLETGSIAAFAPASGWAMAALDSCWNNAVKEASCPMCSSGPLTFPR
ncbi:MAG: hypothetical protein QOF87_1420 [Pseudonocardiales bacterium]|nr:hypothetical protein [Pseudonocardiales bacterium]